MTNPRELALSLANQIGGDPEAVVARAEAYFRFLTQAPSAQNPTTSEEQAKRAAGWVEGIGMPTSGLGAAIANWQGNGNNINER